MTSLLFTRGTFAKPDTSLFFKTGKWWAQKPKHHYQTATYHYACLVGEDAQVI